MSLVRLLALTFLLALAWCGPAGAATETQRPELKCRSGAVQSLITWRRSHVAIARGRVVAYRSPGKGAFASFGVNNVNGVRTVFAVRARRVNARCRAGWYRVQLPLRPNGVRGWIRARDVVVRPVTARIIVDLSARRVSLYVRGRRVLWTRAAIGTPSTPTPTGSYYVNQRLIPYNPYGAFGPGAIGISAFSEVHTGWTQGGPVAIHGTNHPELIGLRVSNGCIRVRNFALRRLFARAVPGTPVTVRL
jgi:hypothetical protein